MPIGFESQYQLDIVMDVKKPHWTWVQDILALYRSAIIYSNGKYKIISDRQDLPVRFVFHAGNTVQEKTEIRIGGDPFRPNQVTVEFASEALDYERDLRIIQDSASIFTGSDAIKPYDLSLTGITRWTEAVRAGSIHLKRKRQIRREVTIITGLEAVPVEAGDVAIFGVPVTNFEAGYGGRALDGSSGHIVLDREVDIKSGFTYDLHVWHTAQNTYELRTVATTVGASNPIFTTVTVSPTAAFSFQIQAGDRWAIGITSEDLMKIRITKVRRNEAGQHEIVGEEYLPLSFDMECPGSITTPVSLIAPSQPGSVSFVVSNCQVCANMFTVPSCIGGAITGPNSYLVIYLGAAGASPHNPNTSALVNEQLFITSGVASGWPGVRSGNSDLSLIASWTGQTSFCATVTIFVPFSFTGLGGGIPNSGDSYYVFYRQPPLGGVEVEISSGAGWLPLGRFLGNSGCVDVTDTQDSMTVRLIPFSDRSMMNSLGPWVASLNTAGCRDIDVITTPTTLTGSATNIYYGITLPGSLLSSTNRLFFETVGLLTEVCSPQTETTDLYLDMIYGSQTVVSCMAVNLNETNSLATIGSNRAVFVDATLMGNGATDRQAGILTYRGPSNSGFFEITRTGEAAIDSTRVQTFAIRATLTHLDNTSTVHSHGCFYLVFQSGMIEQLTSLEPAA